MTVPNVVLVLADDMGYSDLGCYGGEIATPHLDGLARRGVRLSRFYNTARCSPSRASLLTGLHPHQTGIGVLTNDDSPDGYPGIGLPTRQPMLPKQSMTLTLELGPWFVTRVMEEHPSATIPGTIRHCAQRLPHPRQRYPLAQCTVDRIGTTDIARQVDRCVGRVRNRHTVAMLNPFGRHSPSGHAVSRALSRRVRRHEDQIVVRAVRPKAQPGSSMTCQNGIGSQPKQTGTNSNPPIFARGRRYQDSRQNCFKPPLSSQASQPLCQRRMVVLANHSAAETQRVHDVFPHNQQLRILTRT